MSCCEGYGLPSGLDGAQAKTLAASLIHRTNSIEKRQTKVLHGITRMIRSAMQMASDRISSDQGREPPHVLGSGELRPRREQGGRSSRHGAAQRVCGIPA